VTFDPVDAMKSHLSLGSGRRAQAMYPPMGWNAPRHRLLDAPQRHSVCLIGTWYWRMVQA